MVRIPFIYSDNCQHCEMALSIIKSAISKCKKSSCEIVKLKYNDRVSINIAITQGINDLPGFVIGKEVFQGDDYTEAKIIKAIEKSSKNEKR